jgi:DNA sulfur modification protein DndB
LPNEWAKGETDDGFLSINAGVESLIRIFSDIIDYLSSNDKIKAKSQPTEVILNETIYYLDPMINYLENLSFEQHIELRKSYGIGGRTRYWRTLQKSINSVRPEFSPLGLLKYWNDEAQKYNEESYKIIRDLETYIRQDFKKKLTAFYGEDWFKTGVPKTVYDDAIVRAADKNYEAKTKADEVEPWSQLNMIDYRKIATYGRNWSEIFEKLYTKPGEEKISGGKEAKTLWMQKLERIRNENFHTYSVKEVEYELLQELYEWLIEKRVESDIE